MKRSLTTFVPAVPPFWRLLITKRLSCLGCVSLLSEGYQPSVASAKWYSASAPRSVSSDRTWQSEDLIEMEAQAPRSGKAVTRNTRSANPNRISRLPGETSSGFDGSSALRPKKRRKIADGAETVFGVNPVLLALRARKRQFYRLMITEAKFDSSEPHILEILRLCAEFSVPVDKIDAVTLKILSEDRPHQGVCLESSALKPEELAARDLTSILESDDPMNFGAITRSAYFFGVERVLMPDEGSCPLSPVASKASAGTLELLPMHSVRPGQIREVVQSLREKSWTVIGTASKSEAVQNRISRCLDLRDVRPSGHTLLILGNENRGIRQPLLELCNSVVTIQPGKETLMEGADCLNVSVTAGIILSRITSNSSR